MGLRKLVFLACFGYSIAVMAQAGKSAPPVHDSRITGVLDQLGRVRSPYQTALSPDGQWIAWTVAGENSGTEIYAAKMSSTGDAHRITACERNTQGSENEIAWSPDSKHLAFFSDCNREHQQGLYVAEPDVAARRLAAFHGYADWPRWSPNGRSIGLLYVEGATRPAGALAAIKPPAGVVGVEGLEIQRVATVDVATGSMQQVSPANLHVYEFNWSPDSQKLAYVAAPPPGENNWWVAKLYTQEAQAAASAKIVVDPNEAQGPIHGLQLAVPKWSPDGSRIAFISGLMSDQGSTGGDIYLIASDGGEAKDITPGRKATPTWFRWMADNILAVTEVSGGSSHVFSYDIGAQREIDGSSEMLPQGISSGQEMMSLSIADTRDHELGFIASSFRAAPEVWAGSLHDLKQITHYNDHLKPAWGNSESVMWQNEGFDVQGWLLYPANYDPAKKYPLIVVVHGGPSAAVIPHWPGVGFGAAPFSALGYFVLMPNPRGSYGQGEAFTQANRKDFGYGDLRDILAGVDAVTKKYPVDPQRVGLTGWSYGGFMTMFAVTQTNRFHAAVAGAGIANWQSYYGENSIDQWMIPFFGASVYDDPKEYAKSSAINFIQKVKTPTLVVVGDRDGECPMPQSFEFWHALRDRHVPTQLVVYPNEGHRFVDFDHQRDVLERALGWFEQYMPAQ